MRMLDEVCGAQVAAVRSLAAIIIGILAWVALVVWLALTIPQAGPSHVVKAPPVSIPYCPTRTWGQPQVYYPCMYSSREFRA